MPHHKQFKKTLKVTERQNKRNTNAESKLRTFVKKVKTAENKEEAATALKTALAVIDSAAGKKILKKSTAARKKSRLTKLVNKMA